MSRDLLFELLTSLFLSTVTESEIVPPTMEPITTRPFRVQRRVPVGIVMVVCNSQIGRR